MQSIENIEAGSAVGRSRTRCQHSLLLLGALMMYTTDMVVCLNPRQDLTDGLQRQLLDCVSALVPAIQYARAITTVAQLTLLGIAYAGLCV